MNRLLTFPLLAVNEVLKFSLCIWDSITEPVYMAGWDAGCKAGIAFAVAEMERGK